MSSNIRETTEFCLPISQNKPEFTFLEAQLLYNYIDVKDSIPHSVNPSFHHTIIHGTFSYFGHILVICGSIWMFFLRFCHLQFDKGAISYGCSRSENRGICVGFWILSDFRTLSFCGPCWPFLVAKLLYKHQCPSVCLSVWFRRKRDFLGP